MKTILCYGDSNTYGYIPGRDGERYPRDVRWTGVLQKMLGDAYYIIEEGLNGRTTVWDDPIEEDRNGKTYLNQCLKSHCPLDLIIVMLGTNDLKLRFGLPAYDISLGVETLVKMMQSPEYGVDGKLPEVLIVCPPPLVDAPLATPLMGKEGLEKSHQMAAYYKQVAQTQHTWFLDAGVFIESSPVDGLHLTPDSHYNFARALADKINEIL